MGSSTKVIGSNTKMAVAANTHFPVAADVEIKFVRAPTKILQDPQECPVTVIGQLSNLQKIKFEDVGTRLAGSVDSTTWEAALNSLSSGSNDICPLFLDKIQVATLPKKCSRHNAPSRALALSKLVKSTSNIGTNTRQTIVIVCERSEVFASGCAIARAFPTFTRKTISKSQEVNTSVANVPKVLGHKVQVEFIIVDENNQAGLSANDVETLGQSAKAIQLSARIVDTPCNEMHTDAFIAEVRQIGSELGITPLVIQGEDLANQGFGGIYGVGKAAVHAPALVVLSHTPAGAKETVAWVGKGIVYDTGGLSIKGKTAMPGMKRDCGGAAGILGAFYLAVKQGFSQNLHAVFCLAENAVSDRATRPDDIHTLYSGKTVEINNTDAEGRLVVSDGVFYARKDLKANFIVDMCTLTGAQGISTGRYHAAHLTNDGPTEDLAREVGKVSGDMTFPLVYTPELHFCEFESAVADMKNSVKNSDNASASCAGLFINANLGFDYPGVYLHFDMAKPVKDGERATGYGVALLNTLFGQFSNSNLLKDAHALSQSNAKK